MIEDTLKERGQRYGEFKDNALVSQSIKIAMVHSNNWYVLNPTMREALEMTAHKIARILSGDPYYKDSWHDIIGYISLVEETLEGDEGSDTVSL